MAYDWKITAKKFGWSLAQVLVAGAIAWAAQEPMFIGLIPIFEAIRNYIKNRNL